MSASEDDEIVNKLNELFSKRCGPAKAQVAVSALMLIMCSGNDGDIRELTTLVQQWASTV